MKKSFLYSFLFFLSVSTFCSAQTTSQVDSLKQLLQSPPNDSLACTWNNVLFSTYIIANPDSALFFGEKAKAMAEQIGSGALIAENANTFGTYYSQKGDFKSAINYYLKSAKEFEKIDNQNGLADVRSNIGRLYYTLSELEKALPYYLEALEVYQSNGNNNGLANVHNMLAILAASRGALDSSIIYFEKGIVYAQKGGDLIEEARATAGLGEIYKAIGDFDKARNYMLESLRTEEMRGNTEGVIHSYIQLGDFESGRGNTNKAKVYFEKAANYPNLEAYPIKQLLLYEWYGQFLEKEGDIRGAYEYQKRIRVLSDSIANREDRATFYELSEKYETEKKEKEIAELQKNKALKELAFQEEKNKNLILILASVFMLGVVSFISVVYAQTKKRKKEVDEKNEVITQVNEELKLSEENLHQLNKTKDHFFAVISHDLRGPVASFQGISKTLQYQIKKNNTERVNDMMTQVDKSASQLNILLDNLLQWAQSQLGGLTYKPQPILLKDVASDIQDMYAGIAQSKEVKTEINIEPTNLQILADAPSTATILRNLWGNALKFTENGTLSLQAKAENEQVHIVLEDTGTGISEEKLANIFEIDQSKSSKGTQGEKGNGLGLVLCQEFAKQNNGKIEIESQEGKGTKVHLWLPISKRE